MAMLSFQIGDQVVSIKTFSLDFAPESLEYRIISQALDIYNSNKSFFNSIHADIVIHINNGIVIQTLPEVADDIKDMISFLFAFRIK
jgi:hypothetical protein